jgi:hypothetical protein
MRRHILFYLLPEEWEKTKDYGFVVFAEPWWYHRICIGTHWYYRNPRMCLVNTYKDWLDLVYMISHETLHVAITSIGEDEASTILDDLLRDEDWYDWTGLPEKLEYSQKNLHASRYDHVRCN